MVALGSGRVPTRLLAAPPSLPNESPLSWVQRLCGAHQYSIARLRGITGLNPYVGDWDTGVSRSEWVGLLNLADINADSCGEGLYCLRHLCANFLRREILLYEKQMPRYRWCSLCLSSDPIPYLRWDWRLIGLNHCLIHRVPLDDQCGWCNSFLQVQRTLLVSSPDLATCAGCGMALFDREGDACHKPHINQSVEAPVSLMDELLEYLKQCYQLDEWPERRNFPRYADAVRPKR